MTATALNAVHHANVQSVEERPGARVGLTLMGVGNFPGRDRRANRTERKAAATLAQPHSRKFTLRMALCVHELRGWGKTPSGGADTKSDDDGDDDISARENARLVFTCSLPHPRTRTKASSTQASWQKSIKRYACAVRCESLPPTTLCGGNRGELLLCCLESSRRSSNGM